MKNLCLQQSYTQQSYNLRNQTDYSNPFNRLQLYRNSFFPSSIKLWNNLTPEIRSAPTVSNFKKSLINDVNLLKHLNTIHMVVEC